jgi:carbonic anhydrase/acetyltransferase-like protein (isoleucine patch superfamily)
MRHLHSDEIAALQTQGCRAENWQNIAVADDFSAERIYNVSFAGNIALEENVFIRQSHVANYHIKNGAYINNVNELAVTEKTAFGNGVEVSVLNEAGGREVKIFDKLSAQFAYILALYRHSPLLIEKMNALIDKYAGEQRSEMGVVGEKVRITYCGVIRNVKIGEGARLENVAELQNGTVAEQAFVGTGVIARDFMIGKGSRVYDYALLEKTFVGEACEVGKQFSATDSLVFCNSQLLHGEAAAVFAGAYTASHHKSTLLIGSMFSFYNAGSGTNQSNHLYKLGPVHQGVFERGAKTGSGAYLMLEARVGAFSLVLGHHESHFDSSDLPFSYILEKDGRTQLIPAVNFQTVGTQRDSLKWRKRDKRTGDTLDYITFDLLNPYIIGKVINGISVLEKMQEKEADYHSYKGVRVKNIFLKRSIEIYHSAMVIYIGQCLSRNVGGRLIAPVLQNAKLQKWVDVAGLVAPQDVLNEVLSKIETEEITSVEDINISFSFIHRNYNQYEQTFVAYLLQRFFPEKTQADILQLYAEKQTELNNAILADAEKEFGSAAMVGFGIDGDEDTKRADFENVRGRIEDNAFVKEIINK